MVATVHLPPTPGYWVKEDDYNAAKKQRDQLREALEKIEAMVGKASARPGEVLSIAKDALKATEE